MNVSKYKNQIKFKISIFSLLFFSQPSRIEYSSSIGSCFASNEPVGHSSSTYGPMIASLASNISALSGSNHSPNLTSSLV